MSTTPPLSTNSPILRTRLLEGRFSIHSVIARVEALAEFDVRNERRAKRQKLAGVISMILAVLTLLGGLAPLALLGLLAAIVLFVLAAKSRKLDIPNDVRLFALSWLRVVAADMNEDGEVVLKLDLNDVTSQAKRVASGRQGFYTCNEYRNPWFSGDAALADGARLHWEALIEVDERVRYKTKGRTKRKIKHVAKYDVVLGLPQDSFGVAQPSATAQDKVRVKVGEKRVVVRASRAVRSASLVPSRVEDLVATVAMAYRQTTPKTQSEQPA